MEFTLFYEGLLKPNGDKQHKQNIRRFFHKQLIRLWEENELKYYGQFLKKEGFKKDWEKRGFKFIPLVFTNSGQVAQLELFILWQDYPGSIVTNKGDIDNRLKTLFDALKIPEQSQDIPENDFPQEGEDYFYCVLEDDKLITKISITTDRLLYANGSESEVKLFIRVKFKSGKLLFDGKAYFSEW